MPGDRQRGRAHLAAAMAVTMWGTSAVFLKTTSVSGMVTIFYRLWFAIPLLWVLMLSVPSFRAELGMKWLRASVVGGTLFSLHQMFFIHALKTTTVANVTMLGALQPVLVLLVSGPLFGEMPTRLAVALCALAFLGTGVMLVSGSGGPAWSMSGDLLAVGNLLAFTGYFLVSKQIRDGVSPWPYTIGMTTMSGVIVSTACLLQGEVVSEIGTRDAIVMAVVAIVPGTTGHALVNWAHGHASAFAMSMIFLGAPVVSIILAAAFLAESVAVVQGLGAALVLAAIAGTVIATPTAAD